MPLPKMYTELAEYWTLFSDPAEYATEAADWRDVLRDHLGPGRHRVLDLGVGGANNLSHLVDEFDAVGVDASAEMLGQARKLIPGLETHVGDMRTVRLGQTFDAVLIHDAISYMTTEADLSATFATAAEHLRPGGVLIVAPDWIAEAFAPPVLDCSTRSAGGVTVSFFEYTHDPDPSDTLIETLFWYLIDDGSGLRVEHEAHTTGLFGQSTWVELLHEAGFAVELTTVEVGDPDDPRENVMFVGVLGGEGSAQKQNRQPE